MRNTSLRRFKPSAFTPPEGCSRYTEGLTSEVFMVALRQPSLPRSSPQPGSPSIAARFGAEALVDGEPLGTGAGGPVGEMLAELDARLTADEYAHWLLPPEERSGLEKVVHWLSLGAGVIALTGAASLIWFLV